MKSTLNKTMFFVFALCCLLEYNLILPNYTFGTTVLGQDAQSLTSFKYLNSWGSMGRGIGQFGNPISIALDSNDNVYVADSSITEFKSLIKMVTSLNLGDH